MLTLKLEGLDDTIKEVSIFAQDKQDKVEKQISKTLKSVKNRAKQKVPVYSGPTNKEHFKDFPPGSLKKAIKSRLDKKTLEGRVRVSKKIAWYGFFVENGTSKMNAQPFLWPAWEEEKESYLKGIENVL